MLNGTIDAQQFANLGGFKGDAAVVARSHKPKNYSRLCGELVLLPAERRRRRRHAIPLRDARPAGSASSTNGDVDGRQHLQPVEPEGRPAVGGRSDLAGVRQRLAQRRGAELRRDSSEFRVRRSDHPVLPDQAADRDHLRNRHARPAARFHLGAHVYRADIQQRIAMPLQRIRQLQCHQRRSHHPSGHRSGCRRRDLPGHLRQRPDARTRSG